MERDDGHVRGGVGEVDRVALAVADDHLEGVELPAEERPDAEAEGDDLVAQLRGQEPVVDLVAEVQRLGRVVVGDHRLGADGQPAGEDVVALDPGLDVHQLPARGVVGRLELLGVPDAVDVDPAAAVERLHVHRVADPLPHRQQVEGPVVARGGGGEALVLGRDLVGQQPGLGHVEPQPDGGAVAGVLLHRLEGERVVEQVGPVHQGDLLEPLPGVVVPVGQAVDDQGVADRLAQVERLDGDPFGGHLVGLAVELDAGGEPAQVLLERGRPVVLGPEQQADQVGPVAGDDHGG